MAKWSATPYFSSDEIINGKEDTLADQENVQGNGCGRTDPDWRHHTVSYRIANIYETNRTELQLVGKKSRQTILRAVYFYLQNSPYGSLKQQSRLCPTSF